MAELPSSQIRDQLTNRRVKLESALVSVPRDAELLQLLSEVDEAISRLDEGTYGLCKTCQEPIESERLIADPLVQYCLDHLTPTQKQALEQDLELASQIQTALLPRQNLREQGWDTAYHYKGAGPVSGDYCDLLSFGSDLYFTVGDVSGKGVAASMLMAHLHATFRALAPLELPLNKLVEQASRMFCESTLPTHFATLVCGKANNKGEVEICNAGHNPLLLARGSKIEKIKATGLPLGMFCEERFSLSEVRLAPGDTITLYTDGLSEAVNTSGVEYGTERLIKIISENRSLPPEKLISACLKDLKTFQSGVPRTDDLTIMVIRRL